MRNAAAAVTASVMAALLHPAKTSVVGTHGGLRMPGARPRGGASEALAARPIVWVVGPAGVLPKATVEAVRDRLLFVGGVLER